MTIFIQPPEDFSPSAEAVGVFLEAKGKLLYLKRAPSRLAPNTWGIPGGKLEPGENSTQGAIREVFEETGIRILSPEFLGKRFIRIPQTDYAFHVFCAPLLDCVTPKLNEEHVEFRWVTPQEAFSLPLIPAGSEILLFYLS